MASANKYKSLSMKLYKTLEDLKEIMKAHNTWQSDEISKMVTKNLKKPPQDLNIPLDLTKDSKKQDFQRAVTFNGGRRSEFLSARGKQPSRIIEEDTSEEESLEKITGEEIVADEDKVLRELFRTNVN